MNFWKFWPRQKKKESSDRPVKTPAPDADLLDFDLLYQLAYMSSIAASGISRSKIFENAAALQSVTAPYFRQIHVLAEKMDYDYPQACRLVGEKATLDKVKSFFLRFSSALSSGEKERLFLAQEAKVQAAAYRNSYENKLETLRKWTDAYSALIVSAGLIVIIVAVSMMIYQLSTSVLLGLVVVTIGISFLGSYIIYRTAPREHKILSTDKANPKQLLSMKMGKVLIPLAIVVVVSLVLKHAPTWMVMLMTALILSPLGILSFYFDKSVEKKDSEIATLLRALGNTATAIGTTVAESLYRVDPRSLGSLAAETRRLRTRLSFSLGLKICWQKFVSETGSALIDKSVQIFNEGISMGADPEEVGAYAALMAQEVNFLRDKRKLVSSSFLSLTMVMHAAMVGLMSFIVEIISMFSRTIQNMDVPKGPVSGVLSFGMFAFNQQNVLWIGWIMMTIIIVLTFTDAFAPLAAEGGHGYKFFLYFCITLGLSGSVLYVVPKMALSIFKI